MLKIILVLFLILNYCQRYPTQHYIDKGIARYERGDYEGAIKEYDRIISMHLEIAEVYNHRGEARFKLEYYKCAIQDYNKAIELNPRLYISYKNRLIARLEMEDNEGAIEGAIEDSKLLIGIYTQDTNMVKYYTKLIELNPKDATAYYIRGFAKQNLLDHYGAIEDFNEAIELKRKQEKEYPEAYFHRGYAWYNLKDYKKSVEDFNKAIEQDPKYARAYFNRGIAKIKSNKKKDRKGACMDFSKAGELGHIKAYMMIKTYCQEKIKD